MRRYFILLIILILSLIFTGCVGEALRSNLQLKQPVLTRQPVEIEQREIETPDGCYLEIDEKDLTWWLSNDEKECESLFLASTSEINISRTDFHRLLTSLGYGVNEDEIKNKKNNLVVYYKKSSAINYFAETKEKFISNECEEIIFFGIRTYCFNGIEPDKESNLKAMLSYLTTLKFTNTKQVMNQLVDEMVFPFDFVVDTGVDIYDGSDPSHYKETIEEVKCSGGGANYQGPINQHNDINRVYVCDGMLPDKPERDKRVIYAAIIYHEANHKYQGPHMWWHDEDLEAKEEAPEEGEEKIGVGEGENKPGKEDDAPVMVDEIESECRNDTSPPNDRLIRPKRDKDIKSVYGAHIEYLFSMSQNDIFSCEERQFAFNRAENEMKNKLCQKPNKPEHRFISPVCPMVKPLELKPLHLEYY